MKLISPALLIEALAVRYPDSSMLFAPDVFADFVVEYAKDNGFDVPYSDAVKDLDVKAFGPSSAPMWPCPADQAAATYLGQLRRCATLTLGSAPTPVLKAAATPGYRAALLNILVLTAAR